MAAPFETNLLVQFWDNFRHNLFKPLLLFFYMGFSAPLLKVPFDFPHAVYQGLTIYLLVAIGWHGGEELADLNAHDLAQAGGFMAIGFVLNFVIGCLAYLILRGATRLRQVDAATVAGYYGSDSAGTFVTCVGVLTATKIAYAPYMPVMLAVMEIPGCLVALYLVSRLRRQGMDARGYLPTEWGYDPAAPPPAETAPHDHAGGSAAGAHRANSPRGRGRAARATTHAVAAAVERLRSTAPMKLKAAGRVALQATGERAAEKTETTAVMLDNDADEAGVRLPVETARRPAAPSVHRSMFNRQLLHEVFLNPGLFLLFGGIVIGYLSQLQRNPEDVAVIAFAADGTAGRTIVTKEGQAIMPDHAEWPTRGIAAASATAGDAHAAAQPSAATETRAAVLPLDKETDIARHVRFKQKSSNSQLDMLFGDLFQGALCLFLLEMGMTACRRLRDLRAGGLPFIAFGLFAPNVFATIGITVAHVYSMSIHEPFDLGTYVLFAVLCAAASYIAVPAVQRMAIPEASPTLPLAASLGLTFSYNVTIGIPVYIMLATAITRVWPVIAR